MIPPERNPRREHTCGILVFLHKTASLKKTRKTRNLCRSVEVP
jgi:hypothetical protein